MSEIKHLYNHKIEDSPNLYHIASVCVHTFIILLIVHSPYFFRKIIRILSLTNMHVHHGFIDVMRGWALGFKAVGGGRREK